MWRKSIDNNLVRSGEENESPNGHHLWNSTTAPCCLEQDKTYVSYVRTCMNNQNLLAVTCTVLILFGQ